MSRFIDLKQHNRRVAIAFGAALFAATCSSAGAATSCVNPHGSGGCFSTISAAVFKASPNDEIKVWPGVYHDDVVIGKALSLVGAGAGDTFIDATGRANGIYIDGLDHSGLSHVVVKGFTVENARFEGILVTNATAATIWDNVVRNNDKALKITSTGPSCTGQPSYETSEGDDCGEGLHIMGVDHSVLASNVVEGNSGGILISDDTGKTHDNFITRNLVKENPYDCGITLASHGPALGSSAPHHGIVHNTIADNESTMNGLQVPGAGAGVGLFSNGTGIGLVSGNVVIHNKLTDNGLPGVAFHSHVGPATGAPPDDLSDNKIVGNYISGNGADTEDTATPGPTGINVNSGFGGSPITGTVISGNVIDKEADDIVVNTPADVEVHLNDLLGGVGVDNLDSGTVNAVENWWGCPAGPGAEGCATVSGPGVVFTPWLQQPFQVTALF